MVWAAVLLLGCGQYVDGVPAAEWLVENADVVGDVVVSEVPDDAVVIDARPLEDYARGHPAGASSVHWSELGALDEQELWDALPPDQLAQLFSRRGIGTDDSVLVVGAGGADWGGDGAVYWALRYLGHPDVRVLNGGWSTWLALGLEVSDQTPDSESATFDLSIDESLYARSDDVLDWQGNILDVRSEEEWLAGHIPDAVWL